MSSKVKTSKAPTKRQIGTALFKLSQFLITFAVSLIVFGFIFFAFKVSRAEPPNPVPKADGIVVLTGTGAGRLEAGAALLQSELGEKLLISGVNKSIAADEIQSILELPDEKFGCCVTLDYEAENTFENGKETANWARALGYESILLVTSSYHMPRAQIEISTAIDGIRIIPYPVPHQQKADAPWWGGTEYVKGLLREYGKLLVTYAREPGIRATTKPLDPEYETTP